MIDREAYASAALILERIRDAKYQLGHYIDAACAESARGLIQDQINQFDLTTSGTKSKTCGQMIVGTQNRQGAT